MSTVGNREDREAFLRRRASQFVEIIEWVRPMPRMLRWAIGKYIEGVPCAVSASDFVATFGGDPLAAHLREAYLNTFDRKYDVTRGGVCAAHDRLTERFR